MIDRLRKELEHLDALSEFDQEQLADIIQEMWEVSQLPHFDPENVPQDDRSFEEDMAEFERIRGKQSGLTGNQHAVSH